MDFVLARKRIGLTQAQVAEKLGVHQSTVFLWEKGQTKPRVRLLPQLATLYGVTVDELLSEENTDAKDTPD